MYNIFKGMLITTLLCCSAINTNANNTSEALNIEITSNLLQNSDLITEDNLINEYNISIESKDKEVVKILALDGGGTRAYLQTKFLEKFCEDANIDNIGEYFDIIAGTSAGALNAVALASNVTPTDMMTFYREKAPWIFTVRSIKDIFRNNASIPSNKPNKFQQFLMMLFSNPFYKSVSHNSNYGTACLRRTLEDKFGNRSLKSIKTPILLTAYNDSEYYPMVFTNVNFDKNIIPGAFENIKIVDSVMASMSAPIYFPSTDLYISIEKNAQAKSIIDGGVFQNNPSVLAFVTANMLYPSAKNYRLLSIGTGSGPIGLHLDIDYPEPSDVAAMKYVRLFDTTEKNASLTSDIFFKGMSSIPYNNMHYYRFNITLDSNRDCKLDNSKPEFFDYLDNEVERQYKNDKNKIDEFINGLTNTEDK